MDVQEKAFQELDGCEKHLQALLSEAAQIGNYELVLLLAQCARDVGFIAARLSKAEHPKPGGPAEIPGGAENGTRVQAMRPKSLRPKYPRFERRGEDLVKFGWSKQQKREYEHKAPRRLLPVLLASITRAGARGKHFSIDQVLPLSEPDGIDVPEYQAYAWFAWLKHLGIVKQHGRGDYAVTQSEDLGRTVEQAWEELVRAA